MLITVEIIKFKSGLLMYTPTRFLKRKRKIKLCLINWNLYTRKFCISESHILCGLQEKKTRTVLPRWTYLAAACRPQALITWTEIETARAARTPSAVLGVRLYLSPTSSKPYEDKRKKDKKVSWKSLCSTKPQALVRKKRIDTLMKNKGH